MSEEISRRDAARPLAGTVSVPPSDALKTLAAHIERDARPDGCVVLALLATTAIPGGALWIFWDGLFGERSGLLTLLGLGLLAATAFMALVTLVTVVGSLLPSRRFDALTAAAPASTTATVEAAAARLLEDRPGLTWQVGVTERVAMVTERQATQSGGKSSTRDAETEKGPADDGPWFLVDLALLRAREHPPQDRDDEPGLRLRLALVPDAEEIGVHRSGDGRLVLSGANLAEMLELADQLHDEFWQVTGRLDRVPQTLPAPAGERPRPFRVEAVDGDAVRVDGRRVPLREHTDTDLRIMEAVWDVWAPAYVTSADADPLADRSAGVQTLRRARVEALTAEQRRERAQVAARDEMTADAVARLTRRQRTEDDPAS